MKASDSRIDWDEVKNRLHRSQVSLEKALSANEESLDKVYRERAAQLANRLSQGHGAGSALRVLVFSLNTERYALEFADLIELLPFAHSTPVPGAPLQMLGLINVHGEIRSVVDLGRLLDLPDREASAGGYVLLVRKQGREAAWRVDGIDNLVFLAPDQIMAQDEAEAGAALRYLRGLTLDRVRVLNTVALFAHPVYQGLEK